MASGCDIPNTEVLELPSDDELQAELKKALSKETGTISTEAMSGLPQ